MKLIGSNTENAFRAELKASHAALFSDPAKKGLLAELRRRFPNFRTAYVLNWTPDQGEDFLTILVNNDRIAVTEVDRMDLQAVPLVKELPMRSYLNGLSKINQIKLAVAMDLANSDLAE